jgi:hypothetical protein
VRFDGWQEKSDFRLSLLVVLFEAELWPMQQGDVLELHYSRPVAIIVGVLTTLSAAQALPLLLLLLQFNVIAILGFAALAIVGPIYFVLLRYVFRALLGRDPVVILDDRGISDTRQRVEFVPWDDVQRVRLGSGDKSHFLCVELKSGTAGRYTRAPGGWRLLMRFVETLGDWNVMLLTLRCSRAEVAAAAEALRKAAIRRRVERLNRPTPVN